MKESKQVINECKGEKETAGGKELEGMKRIDGLKSRHDSSYTTLLEMEEKKRRKYEKKNETMRE